MRGLDNRIAELASGQRFLITRDEVFDLGGSDEMVMSRLESGLWTRVHPGVYQIDRRPLDWESRLLAAALACGPDALVSHRAALVLWGMDGVTYAPLEVTMPFGNLRGPGRRDRPPKPSPNSKAGTSRHTGVRSGADDS